MGRWNKQINKNNDEWEWRDSTHPILTKKAFRKAKTVRKSYLSEMMIDDSPVFLETRQYLDWFYIALQSTNQTLRNVLEE